MGILLYRNIRIYINRASPPFPTGKAWTCNKQNKQGEASVTDSFHTIKIYDYSKMILNV